MGEMSLPARKGREVRGLRLYELSSSSVGEIATPITHVPGPYTSGGRDAL